MRKDKISLDKEISMITNYIETQRLRFNNVFNYQIDISGVDDSTKVFIPPMLLQPFVENAIEYGVKDKKDTLGLVTICIRKEGSSLFFSIEDNGVGRNEASKHKRISETEHATDVFLERLNRRKKKEELSFTIEDLYNTDGQPIGTKVSFTCLNMIKINNCRRRI